MKRRDFLKLLKKNGWYYKRDGGNHDIYTNGIRTESVPRHTEVDEFLVKAVIKRNKLKK